MGELIKWWKDKLIVAIVLIAVLSVVIAFLFTYFISWGWIIAIIIAVFTGIIIRKIIIKRLNDA